MSYSGKFKDKNNNLHPVTSVLYGTCDTAAGTAAKVVTCADFDTLMTGVTIRVKFDNANTAASPTVNINSTGAKSVYRFGSTAPVDGDSWKAGEVVDLLYDGTSFFMVSADDIGSKQDALTFDDTPTDGSNNPVKSNGIYDSEKDIYAAMGEMGAKNLIQYPYVSSGSSYYQINDDGSITLKGTNTSAQWLRVSDFYLKPGNYIMTASPSGNASGVTMGIGSLDDQDEYTSIASITAPNFSTTFSINAYTRVRVRLYRSENLDFTNNVVLYPMIRLASDTDGTYQPYAKTNKQLTDDVALLESGKADTDMVAADFDAGTSYTTGNYCVQDGKLYKFKNNHSGAWSSADVDEVKITGELSSLKNGLTNLITIVDVSISGTLAANSGTVVPIATTDLPLASKVIGVIAEVDTGSNAIMVGNLVNAGSQYIVHLYNTYTAELAYSYVLHVAVLVN